MKKSILLLSLLFQTAFSLQAQNSADLAMALYNKAENAYNISDFENALSYLGQAEQALGKTNPKLLYLKVKTLDMLTRIDFKKAEQLKQTTSSFLTLTNKATYPADKYQEVLGIDFETKQRIQKEETAYNSLKTTENLAEYDDFFAKYPNSKYQSSLKDKYDQLKTKRKADLTRKFEDEWKAANLKTYKRKKAAAGILLGTGVPCMATGMVLTIVGWVGYTTDSYSDSYGSYGYDKYYFDKRQKADLTMGIIGPIIAVYGIVGLAGGIANSVRAKAIKRDAKEKGIKLSLHTDRVQNQPTVGFAINF